MCANIDVPITVVGAGRPPAWRGGHLTITIEYETGGSDLEYQCCTYCSIYNTISPENHLLRWDLVLGPIFKPAYVSLKSLNVILDGSAALTHYGF